MDSTTRLERFFTRELQRYIPHLSVDCVVFGFHAGELKLLLLKWRNAEVWALPGGYIGRREALDEAASRVLRDRTGLREVHLRQFHAFGGLNRREGASYRSFLSRFDVAVPRDAWPLKRVVSIGYYALVDFARVRPRADELSDACVWFPVDDRPPLAFDHDDVVQRALVALRESLEAPQAGANLLPDRFTMPELQRLHEAILGRPLDRRNFQKRMLERGELERLPERRTGSPHRAPYLYCFKRPPSANRP
jgi:ADP-ribose pyrophosphatase YjhB (NUDIX family)